ncbi:addiction module killer protein [Candidatus Poribacteria bacterium]|nr:MAG: addiction module killer protein [Candidatus Poribacteria bacterium]
MRNTLPQELHFYQTPSGSVPFFEWFHELQDQRTQTRIQKRLQHLKNGNFGDCQSVGDGVYELRLHFGPGYCIYFGRIDNTIVLLLCGGDKSSQTRDIQRAKTYWLEHKETR